MSENLIVSKGRLYEEFKRTLYYEDLKRFLDEQIEICKEKTVEKTTEREYEEAKEFAYKLSGYKSVIEYIDKTIELAHSEAEFLREDREYHNSIPRHV